MYCSASATDWIRSSCLMVVMGSYRLRTRRLARRTSPLLCRSRPTGQNNGRARRPLQGYSEAKRVVSEAELGADRVGAQVAVFRHAADLGLGVIVVVVQAHAEVGCEVVTHAHAAVPAVAISVDTAVLG